MSNIPNSAMPHAGGNSADSSPNAQQQSGFATGPSGNASQNAGSGTSMQSGDYSRGTMQGDRFSGQPMQQDFSGQAMQQDRFSQTSYSDRGRESGGVMDKARDHKTGIALGVAVGAIAAAAIPFMLSGKKKSNERRDYSTGYDREIQVDARTTSESPSAKSRF